MRWATAYDPQKLSAWQALFAYAPPVVHTQQSCYLPALTQFELRDGAGEMDLSETPQTTCLDIPEDLALYIASYLGGEALARLEATSRACGSLYANEAAWEACVRARWHDPRWLDVPMDYYRAATNEALDSLRRARRGSKKPRPS